MLTKEQQETLIPQANATDILIGLQLIERALSTGQVKPKEMSVLGAYYERWTQLLQEATGVNYETDRVPQAAPQPETTQAAPVQTKETPAPKKGKK